MPLPADSCQSSETTITAFEISFVVIVFIDINNSQEEQATSVQFLHLMSVIMLTLLKQCYCMLILSRPIDTPQRLSITVCLTFPVSSMVNVETNRSG